MIIGIIILAFVVIVQAGLLIYYIINQKKIQQKNLEDYLLQHRDEIDDTLEKYRTEKRREMTNELGQARAIEEEKLAQMREYHDQIIGQIEEKRKLAEEAEDRETAQRRKNIETSIEAFRTLEMQKARTAIDTDTASHMSWAEDSLAAYWDTLAEKNAEMEEETRRIEEALMEWQKKQHAINEEIMRRKEVEDGKDFYRVVLTPEAVEDIILLMNLRHKLHNHDKLDELIYDVYYSKPVMEMTKRVLHGGEPSGIYKITRLKTGEIYIGKSTNVKKRWSEHCKTALGVGTIAHSILHTTMEKDGIDDFTFELLEEVPKEKLTEREKYWITFYDSKSYGLNERNG